jgi:hypothetical protein
MGKFFWKQCRPKDKGLHRCNQSRIYFFFPRPVNPLMKNKRDSLLTYKQSKYPAHLDCWISLSGLLPTRDEREKFNSRYKSFLDSDADNRCIYELKQDTLFYTTEQLIPVKTDDRRPVLLIFGNPASHSIKNGMFFSPKDDGKENRFWKHLLHPAGVLDLVLAEGLSTKDRNKLRLERMLALNYDTPFRIGLCVYWSMPSSAGGPWSGVAGIRSLLGKKAMEELERFERGRVLEVAEKFLNNGGIAVTFQKDAWEGLRSEHDPPYNITAAKEAKLRGCLRGMKNVFLYGVPPTRLVGPCRRVLEQFLGHE